MEGAMKKYITGSLFLFAISTIILTMLIFPVSTSAESRIRVVSIYQSWNWNYGEPGHDPDWIIRGRDNNNGKRGEGNNGNGKGNEDGDNNNGNGVGNGVSDLNGGENSEIIIILDGEELTVPEIIYFNTIEILEIIFR